MQNNQLKRSSKTDFPLSRERSFVKPSKDPQKRRSQAAALAGLRVGKPAMEIYRPPNVRTDSLKLNVHAKEFTMNNQLQNSKSSGNIAQVAAAATAAYHHQFLENSLQHSKSSGNILHHPLQIPILPSMALPILHNFPQLHRVNFQLASEAGAAAPPPQMFASQMGWNAAAGNQQRNSTAIKRSKSLGAADSATVVAAKMKGYTKEETDLGQFSKEDREQLKAALADPNGLASRTLMDLVKTILERVVEGIRYSEPGAKLCISIIEKEKNQTFIESLINTCQQWFQERDKILRGVKATDGTRFTAFMWFLTEMCSQLKRYKHQCQCENGQADLILLSILAKCCQACVSMPIRCLSETECLFFVLTSIGRDLESELPQQLEQLLSSIRDAFLSKVESPAIKKTLLQLIELHGSNWQLTGSSVLYYYPKIK